MKKENPSKALEDNRLRMRSAKARVTRMQKKIQSVAPEREVSIPSMVGKWQSTDEMLANQTE